jgi:hypothetical protein
MIKINKLLKKETYSKITLKYVLFINILVWLSCPIWHNFIFIFDFQDIEGLDKKSEPANFNFKNWISADYQLSVEKYLINHNPISPFFIRLKNQIDYSLFEEINISNGIVCKDFYLFQKDYIDAYVGTDFIGKESLRAYVEKMKFVQDTLQRLHKEFIYIQAPDKATFYPEFLPDSIQQKVTNQTNYNELNKLIVEYKINYIDFVPYFLKAKKTSEYPLFTQTGIHWSIYSTVLVMDSLNRYIERNMNIDIPNIYYDDIEVGYARLGDADLEGMSNLLFTISDIKYGYPNYKFEPRENKDAPYVTLISDSYLGGLYWGNWFQSFNKESQFWFYNKSMYSLVDRDRIHKYQLDQNAIINKSDIVIVSCNKPNIRGTSWDFIDEMYDYYKYGKRVVDNEVRVEFLRRVDSCKVKLSDSEISKAGKYMESQNVSLDSAKVIYSIWKMNQFIF